ncbi:MAG: LysR family transcriptional regulator [Castellaniella sp.]
METQHNHAIWSSVHWLIVLEQQGSFTLAARRLGVSKAAVSQRVAELERMAGLPLVRRTTRSVHLTEAGRQLVEDTRDAFDQILWSFTSIRELAEEPAGLVRVTAPVALARQQLVPRLPEFLYAYPRIRVELDLSDQLSSLVNEGFDLAVRHAAQPPETHVAWQLCTTRPLLVASPAYLARQGRPRAPGDLARHHCLTYPRPRGRLTWTLESGSVDSHADGADRSRLTIPVQGVFAANNSEVLREMALAGLGIAVVPDFSVQSALRTGALVAVLPGWKPVGTFSETIYAIRPYSPQVPQAVQLLVGFLREVMRDGFAVPPR